MARKILIAEDELHIRLLIEQSIEELEDEGVEILSAADGEEALSMICAERPDLVLLDAMMPKMNGFEVCERIRRESNLAGVQVVMLTAKGQEYDRKRGSEAGVDLYLTKPFNPDDLLDIARRAVGLDGK